MDAGSNKAIFHGATEENRRKAAKGTYVDNTCNLLLQNVV